MKLLIISNMAHYMRDGEVVGWGPTVQEINHLAALFEEIRHIGCLYPEPPPQSSMAYSSSRVTLIPVQPSGGRSLTKKFGILAQAPNYISVMKTHLKWADMVQVRCPANISLMAILLLGFISDPDYRWVLHAGNWSPTFREAWSLRLQRWLLKRDFHRGIATINGVWPGQGTHLRSLLNPCFAEDELQSARRLTHKKQLSSPFHFLFAGTLEDWKGVGRALSIVAELHRMQIPVRLDLAGDSQQRAQFERKAAYLGLHEIAYFHGWISRTELDHLYARAHFLLFASETEGFPKVLSEGMAYGVVPIAGAVGSIAQTLSALHCGVALPVHDQDRFVSAIVNYIDNPEMWQAQSHNGISAAEKFLYSEYIREVAIMLNDFWEITLPVPEKSLL